jgi:hypothetical protein
MSPQIIEFKNLDDLKDLSNDFPGLRNLLDIFCGMDHQRPNFSVIYGTLFDRGC